MIAHRLTTIKNCDRIIVVGNHSIVEEGSHDELLANQGEYYKMLNSNKKKVACVLPFSFLSLNRSYGAKLYVTSVEYD